MRIKKDPVTQFNNCGWVFSSDGRTVFVVSSDDRCSLLASSDCQFQLVPTTSRHVSAQLVPAKSRIVSNRHCAGFSVVHRMSNRLHLLLNHLISTFRPCSKRLVSALPDTSHLISSRHVPSCRWQSLLPWRDSPKDCRRPNLSSSWNCSFMSFFEEFFFFVPKILFCVREEGFIVGRLSSILGCSHFTLPSSWQFSQQEEGKERKSGEEGQRSNSQDS